MIFLRFEPKLSPKQMTNEDFAALFQLATEGIMVVNHDGNILEINRSAEAMFGYDQGELRGKPVELLVPHKFRGNHSNHRERYSDNPHARPMGRGMDLYGIRKDGSEFAVEVSLSPYTQDDKKYIIVFIIDITQRKFGEEQLKNYSVELEKEVEKRTMILREAVQELEKTKEDLNDALMKEKELNDLKSRFVAMASHEFRTPLATILSSIALITKYAEMNDLNNQMKHVGRIKSSISHLTDMLNDILSLSKLEEGKLPILLVRFRLTPFISEAVKEMQAVAKPGQHIRYEHTGHDEIVLDQKILRNVFNNLVSNALKYSPENTEVIVRTDVSPEYIMLQVQDYGSGISEEDQKHLFERFFRGRSSLEIQGTGLGLSLVSKYMELLGGTISFNSKLDEGSTFTIRMPNNFEVPESESQPEESLL